MNITEPEDEYGYDVMAQGNAPPPIAPRRTSSELPPPPIVPRGGSDAPPPIVPRGGQIMSNDIYDDNDGDASAALGAITMEQIYVTDEIKTQPWFVGSIDRAESEKLLKQGDRLGNFLVREKVQNKTFVHSYLSLTRMTIIHNMIEFHRDGSCLVDNKKWPHGDKPSLEDVIDKMQEIRRQRKNVKTQADAAILRSLKAIWPKLCKGDVSLKDAHMQVKNLNANSFMVVKDATAGPRGYVIVIHKGNGKTHQAMCPCSAQGQYLKYSELSGPTMVDLAAMILSNPDAAKASGLPKLTIPSAQELDNADAPPPPPVGRRTVPPPLQADNDEIYDDVEDEAPPPPVGRRAVPPPISADDIYDDGDEQQAVTEEDIYDD